MLRLPALALSAALAALTLPAAPPAQAAGSITCKMRYSLTGWSVFYKRASGTGTVSCSNGQRMAVRLTARGGGPTVGKYTIPNGFGEFAGVTTIRDVLGTYASAGADAAAGKAATAQAMTKGDVSLALSGKGEGWNLGVAFTGFTIEAR
ncbi:hypothetical protein [Luteimonas vadosa]|uniref:Uncharacterized protein n=1 Tax=Luteimonas vadosa TaxID=1165507 RepID=A0ABP9DME3_9GAMM